MSELRGITLTGRTVDLFAPSAEDISPSDIAAGLANRCLFGNQVVPFYSAAQHSLYVADLVDAEDRLWALLCLSPSAYMGDWPGWFQTVHGDQIEPAHHLRTRLMLCIAERFGLCRVIPDAVSLARDRVLAAEIRDLGVRCARPPETVAMVAPIIALSPDNALDAYRSVLFAELEVRGVAID